MSMLILHQSSDKMHSSIILNTNTRRRDNTVSIIEKSRKDESSKGSMSKKTNNSNVSKTDADFHSIDES